MIRDSWGVFFASFIFHLSKTYWIYWNCDWLNDQPTDRLFYRDTRMHMRICPDLFMASNGFYSLSTFSVFLQKLHQWTDGRTGNPSDGWTFRWTVPLIEMWGCIWKRGKYIYKKKKKQKTMCKNSKSIFFALMRKYDTHCPYLAG